MTFSSTIVRLLITTLLTVLTVSVALVSTRYEHLNRKRKMTVSGWKLSGLIIVLGIASIAWNAYDVLQNAAKEETERVERSQQFAAQMIKLTEATSSLTKLKSDMTQSLDREQQLFMKSDLNLHGVTNLQKQQIVSTDIILRHVFAESNRVAAERIALTAIVKCPTLANRFVEYPYVENISLVLKRPHSSHVSLATSQRLELSDGRIFHGFLGDLGPFEAFEAWQGASVDIKLDGELSFNSGRILTLDDLQVMTPEQAVAQINGEVSSPDSCPIAASLLVNGRTVLRVAGQFVRTRSTSDSKFEAVFNSAPVDSSLLPSFKK